MLPLCFLLVYTTLVDNTAPLPMSTLVIKNLPDDLHARLKDQADRHRRSVTQEAILLIETGITVPRLAPMLAPPVKLKGGQLTTEEILTWVDEGRE
jgi:hypothetical protein